MSELIRLVDGHLKDQEMTRHELCELVVEKGFEAPSVPTPEVLNGETPACIGVGEVIAKVLDLSEEEGEEMDRAAYKAAKAEGRTWQSTSGMLMPALLSLGTCIHAFNAAGGFERVAFQVLAGG
jgi:hypothetical protein